MNTTQEERHTPNLGTTVRARAGRALLVFLAIMALITFAGNTLQEMVIPVVKAISPQRGMLEKRVDASGTLSSAKTVPLSVKGAARVAEIPVKTRSSVMPGDPLMVLDYAAIAEEKYHALVDALNALGTKLQAYDWAAADISTQTVDSLEARREALTKAENALAEEQAALALLLSTESLAALALEEAATMLAEAELSGDAAAISAASALRAEASKAHVSALAALKKSQARAKELQNTVDTRKRRLEEYRGYRSYMTASRELATAREATDIAARNYFDICTALDTHPYGAEASSEALIDAALRTIQFGGRAEDVLPFHWSADYTRTVRSPVPGEVFAIGAEAGHLVEESKPIITLTDLSAGLSLTVTVSEDEAAEMVVGDPAEILVGEDAFECPIISIAASSENDGRYTVEFAIPRGYGSVGQKASLRFRKHTQRYDLLIPLGALREDSAGTFVYILDRQEGSLGAQTTAKRVDVYVLDKDATRAALQGGVSQRDSLIVRSDRDIQEGDRVRLEEA